MSDAKKTNNIKGISWVMNYRRVSCYTVIQSMVRILTFKRLAVIIPTN